MFVYDAIKLEPEAAGIRLILYFKTEQHQLFSIKCSKDNSSLFFSLFIYTLWLNTWSTEMLCPMKIKRSFDESVDVKLAQVCSFSKFRCKECKMVSEAVKISCSQGLSDASPQVKSSIERNSLRTSWNAVHCSEWQITGKTPMWMRFSSWVRTRSVSFFLSRKHKHGTNITR